MKTEVWIGLSSAIIALLAMVLSIVFFIMTRRNTLRTFKYNVRKDYQSQLREWASEAILLYSNVISLCYKDPSQMGKDAFFNQRVDFISTFSSLIDNGRFLLPNKESDKFGTEKEAAYRGFRQYPLDLLIEGLHLTTNINYLEKEPNLKLKDDLVANKRKFVSEIQSLIDIRNEIELMNK